MFIFYCVLVRAKMTPQRCPKNGCKTGKVDPFTQCPEELKDKGQMSFTTKYELIIPKQQKSQKSV